MELKKLLIILTVVFTTIIIIMMGVSYGWYAYSNAESEISGTTINETPTVIFKQTEYITSNINSPIYDEDRYNYATKNSFTVTLGENLKEYETGLEISLENIKISEELKTINYKYELLENGKTISQGNFESLGDATSIKLLPMTKIIPQSYPTTYNYEFYIWLSEDETNQNNLMNKNFSAKINVNSAIKK